MKQQSMTGFSRSEGQFEAESWTWEIRSVNGKNLDLRFRLPPGLEAVESKAKKQATERFTRGNFQVSLHIDSDVNASMPSLNTKALDDVLAIAKSICEKTGGPMPTTADLMNLRGVMEYKSVEMEEKALAKRQIAILESFDVAVEALLEMRLIEGNAVASVLLDQVEKISELHAAIDGNEARSHDAIRKQLQEQVRQLISSSEELDPQRLHQEAVILATKADIQEELDRLAVHLVSVKKLLNGDGPVGRKLDFLAQELHRECNTICSKSNSAEVTALGLDMKLVIEQFREQTQNLE